MNLKRWKIVSCFIIFGLCFINHFGYTFMPNIITSFFFPVNESIYEHMKMIYTTIVIFSVIEYFVFKANNIVVKNLGINPFISGISNVIIFLIIYLPIRTLIGENMTVTLIILFISIIVTEYISYIILTDKHKVNNTVGIILTISMFFILAYFTYYPVHNYLFYDTQNKIYGIK